MSPFTDSNTITLAIKKNRIGTSKLEAELNRINREEMIAMRMHNNAKQRFKNKYARLDVFDSDRKGSEASDIVMYETHTPGFCYRRNGECRQPNLIITSKQVDMSDLHQLLFTEGEIDIEKVLCLHLLTAHKTDTLSKPPASEKINFLNRERSPLERLIDRSKRRNYDIIIEKNLPLYILNTQIENSHIIKDQRLFGKIIVNEKIVQIVDSVVSALQKSNKNKLRNFQKILNNKDSMRRIIQSSKIQDFLRSLNTQNIISNSESFYLASQAKLPYFPLTIENRLFEFLLKEIRTNIFKLPNSQNWVNLSKAKAIDNAGETIYTIRESIGINEIPSTDVRKALLNQTTPLPAYALSAKQEEVEFSLDYDLEDRESLAESKLINYIPLSKPKILRNMQKGFSSYESDEGNLIKDEEANSRLVTYAAEPRIFKYCESDVPYKEGNLVRINLKSDEENSHISGQSSFRSNQSSAKSMTFERMAVLLNQKVQKEIMQDYQELEQESVKNIGRVSTERDEKDNSAKFLAPKPKVKQTRCEACREKWKKQLPLPQLADIRKSTLVPSLAKTANFTFTSKSAQRISKMINDEVRRFGEESTSNETSKTNFDKTLTTNKKMVKNGSVDTSIEIIDLDDLDLAKIRQEIKENETKKKLDQFLKY